MEDVEKAYLIIEAMGVFSWVYILVGPTFVKDPKNVTLKSVSFTKKIGFKEAFLLEAYPIIGSAAYKLWKKGDWLPLRKDEFDEIIRLAQDIKPNIEFSSEGLE